MEVGAMRVGAMEKRHSVRKVLLQLTKSLFVLFDATAEPANCSLF